MKKDNNNYAPKRKQRLRFHKLWGRGGLKYNEYRFGLTEKDFNMLKEEGVKEYQSPLLNYSSQLQSSH